MNEQYPPQAEPPVRRRGLGIKVALVGAGIAAGAVTATALGANAATSGSGTTGTAAVAAVAAAPTTATTDTGTKPDRHGSAPVRSDEKTLSAALTAKLKAAALKAVPGGTVYRVESDSGDGTYEAHMTKADGTEVTVKFDSAGAVTGVETGMGK